MNALPMMRKKQHFSRGVDDYTPYDNDYSYVYDYYYECDCDCDCDCDYVAEYVC